MDRRRFLAHAVAALAWAGRSAARPGGAPGDELETFDLTLAGDPAGTRAWAGRALVFAPKGIPGPLPLVVLLHGLGETASEALGVHAWSERYGLLSSYRRLRSPPVAAGLDRPRYLSPARAAAIDAALARQPFRPLVLACPYMPNPHRRRGTIDAYAAWLERTLLPAVRDRTAASGDAERTAIAGCSLGGYVGLEVFLRKPERFGAFAGVQSALAVKSAPRYAAAVGEAIARLGRRAVLLETSTEDPYRAANEALAGALAGRGVAHDLIRPPGPHTQPWLVEVGTLEMLLWLDRALAGGPPG